MNGISALIKEIPENSYPHPPFPFPFLIHMLFPNDEKCSVGWVRLRETSTSN